MYRAGFEPALFYAVRYSTATPCLAYCQPSHWPLWIWCYARERSYPYSDLQKHNLCRDGISLLPLRLLHIPFLYLQALPKNRVCWNSFPCNRHQHNTLCWWASILFFFSFHLRSFCFVKRLFDRFGISGPEIQCSLRQGHKPATRKNTKQKSRYIGNRNKSGEKISPRSYSVGSLCNSF